MPEAKAKARPAESALDAGPGVLKARIDIHLTQASAAGTSAAKGLGAESNAASPTDPSLTNGVRFVCSGAPVGHDIPFRAAGRARLETWA